MTSSKTIVDTSNNSNNGRPSSLESQNIDKYDFEAFEQEGLPYTMIPNQVIQNMPPKHISAGFLWVYLQSLPSNWQPNKSHLMKHFSMSARTYSRNMAWLKSVGLIEHQQKRNEDGSFGAFKLTVLNGAKFNPDGLPQPVAKYGTPVDSPVAKKRQCGETDIAANGTLTNTTSLKTQKVITKTTADDDLIEQKGAEMGATPREIETAQRKIRAKRQKGDEITSVDGLAGHIIAGLRKGTQKFYEGSQRQQAKSNDDSYYGVPKHHIEKHARPGESYESAAGRLRDSYFRQA